MRLWDKLIDRFLGGALLRWAGVADSRAYAVSAIVLAAKLAKVDGPITRVEIDAFKSLFRIAPEDTRDVARVWRAAKRDARGFESYARKLGVLFADEPKTLHNMLAALFEVARADGPLQDSEIAYLSRVAQAFGLPRDALSKLRGRADAAPSDPYSILGVAPGATDVEIKRAWRRLVRVYHPDAVSGQGRPRHLVATATQKTAAINAAYETILRERALRDTAAAA